ncbi:MAG: hypothetical protein AAGH87_00490 [Pseudomonadota bacterium]
MADGSDVTWPASNAAPCMPLMEAISALKAGKLAPGTGIDLGSGSVVEYTGAGVASDLLARLEAHARLVAFCASAPQEQGAAPPPVCVDSHAKALLDAVASPR